MESAVIDKLSEYFLINLKLRKTEFSFFMSEDAIKLSRLNFNTIVFQEIRTYDSESEYENRLNKHKLLAQNLKAVKVCKEEINIHFSLTESDLGVKRNFILDQYTSIDVPCINENSIDAVETDCKTDIIVEKVNELSNMIWGAGKQPTISDINCTILETKELIFELRHVFDDRSEDLEILNTADQLLSQLVRLNEATELEQILIELENLKNRTSLNYCMKVLIGFCAKLAGFRLQIIVIGQVL